MGFIHRLMTGVPCMGVSINGGALSLLAGLFHGKSYYKWIIIMGIHIFGRLHISMNNNNWTEVGREEHMMTTCFMTMCLHYSTFISYQMLTRRHHNNINMCNYGTKTCVIYHLRPDQSLVAKSLPSHQSWLSSECEAGPAMILQAKGIPNPMGTSISSPRSSSEWKDLTDLDCVS